jgi:hypothetical protein
MDLGGALGLTEPLKELDMTRADLAISYEADNDEAVNEHEFDLAWMWKRLRLPGMYMPRNVSRLTLTITEVRHQRLHDITDEDAIAEGIVERVPGVAGDYWVPGVEQRDPNFPWLSRPTPREMYAALWDTLHGSGQWLGNPEVVTISFEPKLRNIDNWELV